MKIAVIGTGYVGSVSGTCFAETGNQVTCVDIDEQKVAQLNKGILPIFEPGLELLLERNLKDGRLTFTTDLEGAVQASDVIFLALPTPPGADGAADLSFVVKVAHQLGTIIKGYKVIVNKSTVPVGTGALVKETIASHTDVEFDVVSNPEFLREGVAVEDFLKPDRVVIGCDSPRAEKTMRKLYEPFVRQGNPIFVMDIPSAELTKYAANSYLATRISFMNEIANICEKVGANADQVRIGIGSDSRIGKRFLFPGIGYGGSCFPKDVSALHQTAKQNEYDFRILDSVMAVNKTQRELFTEKVMKYFNGNIEGLTFGAWGLSFKPNTDDIRDAPAIDVIKDLLDKGAKVKAFDPEAMDNVKAIFGDKVDFQNDQYGALKGVDALLIFTEWNIFRTPDFEKMRQEMGAAVIFDGRNLYKLENMVDQGFYYNSIGRHVVDNLVGKEKA